MRRPVQHRFYHPSTNLMATLRIIYMTTTHSINYNEMAYLRSSYLMQLSGEKRLKLYVVHAVRPFSYPHQLSVILFQYSLGKTVKICAGKGQYQPLDAAV
jgi:hypothetical protein